ncbi:MAG: hypothetical protein JWP65_853 [Ramlibacter sp.]|jgi:hypothetical protein|uniref:hypothetical protein n=1 Tax=Ramlibacter sp. TaxID=1917967 RepID=UPI002613271D|nr:hypothetical protein [Ramlibacter sp.]MDB5750432.1 hypothetical protein [Ramlibacter sp.]
MSGASFLKFWAPGLLALGMLLATCAAPPGGAAHPDADEAADDTRQRLQGTWLREYEAKGIRARRVLVLEPDGAFREKVRATDGAGRATEQAHEGTWLFDGTNLKRKYTLMNGRPPSRLNLPLATFQIAFETPNEFLGVDHIHGNKVRYRRVAAGMEP